MKTTIALSYLSPAEMSRDELEAIVGKTKMSELRQKDEHPDLRAYVIAHEGHAIGNSSIGTRVFEYFKQTIKAVYNRLGIGTPAYIGHGTGAREPVGEVIGRDYRTDENGISYVVAVMYMYPRYKDTIHDIASIETDSQIDNDKIYDVDKIKAVALSSSKTDSPGFSPHLT